MTYSRKLSSSKKKSTLYFQLYNSSLTLQKVFPLIDCRIVSDQQCFYHVCDVAHGSNFLYPVRLIQGNRLGVSQGTVEIFYNSAWGSVCDDYWGLSDARVVCRMLGFSDAIRGWR